MSDYNLNDPNAFAALTTAFGSVFGQPENQKWNISQSAYKNVPFHIFTNAQGDGQEENYQASVPTVHDRTGRRKVFYEFPFQDGQTSGDLGRKPFVFEFNVVFFGPNYFVGYQSFYNALNEATPGVLRHPVLGDVNCVGSEWEVTHQSTERMALTMRVVFQEHTFDPGLTFQNVPALGQPVSTGKPSTFKSAVIAALTAFQTLDNVITTVQANVAYAQNFRNGISNRITTYKAAFLLTLQSLYLNFSPTSVSSAPDLPGVLPVNLGGQVTGSGTVVSPIYPLINASQTPFSEIAIPSSQLSPTGTPLPLTPLQAQAKVNNVLVALESIVQSLNAANNGQGSLDFYDQVLALKQGGLQLRLACLQGIASSKNLTTQYMVDPVLISMSVREVAFAIGLSPEFSDQITQLNPQILSVNFIPGGTVLNVPLST